MRNIIENSDNIKHIIPRDIFNKLTSSNQTEHLDAINYKYTWHPERGLIIRPILDGKACLTAYTIHKDDVSAGYENILKLKIN